MRLPVESDALMRLTLRTLLAWLDDTLPPAEVREIGQQVTESSYAKELVERIRKSTRRRRLTIPPSSGPDAVDPNIVANYLDNVLDPAQVAEYEKRCLASDVHLAEVASTHQILSLIGQRAKVPATARQRMYKIVKGPETILRDLPSTIDTDNGSDILSQTLIPQEAKRSRSWLWLVPLALAAIIFAGLLSTLWIRPQPDRKSAPRAVISNQDLARLPLEEPKSQPQLNPQAVPPGALAQAKPGMIDRAFGVDTTDRTAPPLTVASADQPPADQPEPPRSDATEKPLDLSAEPPAAAVKKSDSPPIPPLDRERGQAVVPAGAAASYLPSTGVTLRERKDKRSWDRVQPGETIRPEDHLINLGTTRAHLALPDGQLTLVGEGEVVLTPGTADQDVRLDAFWGRLLLMGGAKSRRFAFRDPSGTIIELVPHSPRSRIAVERLISPTPQDPWLAVQVLEGDVSIARGDAATKLDPRSSALVSTGVNLVAPGPVVSLDWARASTPIEDALADRLAAAFPQNRPPIACLLELIEDRAEAAQALRPMAISSLALLGQLDLVLGVMNRPNDPQARQAAMSVIRWYAARGPQFAEEMRARMIDFAGVEWARIVESLLGGVPRNQASNPEVLHQLLAFLNHPDTGIRQLALINLMSLTNRGDAMGYDPDKPDEGEGLKEWQNLVNEIAPRSAANNPGTTKTKSATKDQTTPEKGRRP
jgi:hypothetical protein